jgi:hypothetical protein
VAFYWCNIFVTMTHWKCCLQTLQLRMWIVEYWLSEYCHTNLVIVLVANIYSVNICMSFITTHSSKFYPFASPSAPCIYTHRQKLFYVTIRGLNSWKLSAKWEESEPTPHWCLKANTPPPVPIKTFRFPLIRPSWDSLVVNPLFQQ